jgi:prolyl-tRNA synthetase
MFVAYLRTFHRLGLTSIPMRADSGAIGGDLSHEFIVLADTGESAVYCDRAWLDANPLEAAIDYNSDLQPFVDRWTRLYAVTDEKHDAKTCSVPPERLYQGRGIEVGHIFYFGIKYSKAMKAMVTGEDGSEVLVEMGSYGIGISRLVAALIEASHDDRGIIWPECVAPFKVGLINLRTGDGACDRLCEDLYNGLRRAGVETLYDDRDERAGVKFASMDLIGLPWQIAVGPRGVAAGTVELRARGQESERLELAASAVLERLTS